MCFRYNVIVVGAGLSGLCMGAKLSEGGVPFTICEASTEVGGTWHLVMFGQLCISFPSFRTQTGEGTR